MADIDWASVIEYCQWAASEGRQPTNSFTEERQSDLPADYQGGCTVWPSRQEAVRHFCENPDAWALISRGYEWRAMKLHDKIASYRKGIETGTYAPPQGRVLIDSVMSELKLIREAISKDEKAQEAAKKAAEKSNRPTVGQLKVTVADRLAQAEAEQKSTGYYTSKRKPPKGRPATEWGDLQ